MDRNVLRTTNVTTMQVGSYALGRFRYAGVRSAPSPIKIRHRNVRPGPVPWFIVLEPRPCISLLIIPI